MFAWMRSALRRHRLPVGIVTFHCSLNEGAQMQAWALQRFLDAEAGRTAIVDYRPPERTVPQHERWNVPHKDLLDAYPERIRCSPPFTAAQDAAEWINNSCAAVVCGSDEIWKFAPGNAPVPVFMSVPNLYYGCGVRVPRFAYAVSISDADVSSLDAPARARIAGELKRFSFIGVRDEATAAFVRDLSPSFADAVRLVPDPTFALDLKLASRERMRERLTALGIDPRRPLAVVVPTGRHTLPIATIQSLHDEGYQVISTYENNGIPHAESLRLDPHGWFSLIAAADFVMTERMHGLIAALIANVPCIAVSNRAKVRSLIAAFGLPVGDAAHVRREWPHARVEDIKRTYRGLHREAAGYLRDAIR